MLKQSDDVEGSFKAHEDAFDTQRKLPIIPLPKSASTAVMKERDKDYKGEDDQKTMNCCDCANNLNVFDRDVEFLKFSCVIRVVDILCIR